MLCRNDWDVICYHHGYIALENHVIAVNELLKRIISGNAEHKGLAVETVIMIFSFIGAQNRKTEVGHSKNLVVSKSLPDHETDQTNKKQFLGIRKS